MLIHVERFQSKAFPDDFGTYNQSDMHLKINKEGHLGFPWWKRQFCLSMLKQCGAHQQKGDARLLSPLTPIGSLELL